MSHERAEARRWWRLHTKHTARGDEGRLVPGWVMFVACLGAVLLATLGPGVAAKPAPQPASSSAPAQVGGAPAAPATRDALRDGYTTAHAPMPKDAEVPLEWMPPGSNVSPLPSEELFPPQTLTIRFNHKKHVKELKQTCKACHAAAYTSEAVTDRLLPKPAETCDHCHDVDHADLAHVKAGTDANGQCIFCHLGENAGVDGKVAPLVLPSANLRFTHEKHLSRNIQCGQCHGQVEQLELATRNQLPRMAGCFACHAMSGAAQGEAKSACTTCHLTRRDGRLATSFSTGALLPPRWLHNAGHATDWIERHKAIAADDSAFCGSCHNESDCTNCHDGKVRNRKVHPNDWISMHPEAARQDNPRCVSCHQAQTFCADCHRRTGVARDSVSGNRPAGLRFHPPPAEWTYAPRSAKHHAWEAERNLNACVACHTERDCATCHATKGVAGGQGVNPHPLGFRNKCNTAFSRNPRPCLVCHQSSDSFLKACQ